MRVPILGLLVVLCIVGVSQGFVCRSWPFGKVPDAVVRDDVCDCCDCSDEPGTDYHRDSCVKDEASVAAAQMMKERTHRKTKKTPVPDIPTLVKDAASKMRERARVAEEAKKVAEAREVIVHSRIRRERMQTFGAALDAMATSTPDAELVRMITDLAASFNESSAEWVVDAIAQAGLTHVDRTDAVALGAKLEEAAEVYGEALTNDTRSAAMATALGVDTLERSELIKIWKAALQHENGTIMIDAAGMKEKLPQHWNATEFPPQEAAIQARISFAEAKKDEEDTIKAEKHLEGRRVPFNLGANRSLSTVDGRCFDIPPAIKGEQGFRHERPSKICLYRYARYSKFTSLIVDLRTSGVPMPMMLFTNNDTIKACGKEGGHKTIVSFACFTEDMFLFTDAISRCTINVTYGTPLGC